MMKTPATGYKPMFDATHLLRLHEDASVNRAIWSRASNNDPRVGRLYDMWQESEVAFETALRAALASRPATPTTGDAR